MSATERHAHETPSKTPKRFITVILLAFVVPVIAIILIVQLVTTYGMKSAPERSIGTELATANRIRPVAGVNVAGSERAADQTGEEVVKSTCVGCHGPGTAGAPKIGDQQAWAKRIEKGLEQLTKSAIAGVRSMPSHGGNEQLSDLEIARAIVTMANQSGGKLNEPVGPASRAAARTPEQIVQLSCGNCHLTGKNGAPKIGDRAAWTPLVSRGLEAVTQAAVNGHGNMPARGGLANLTESEIRNTIVYMFNLGTGKPAAEAAPAAKQAAAAPAAAKKADGKSIYEASCVACHAAGVAGAPKAGDKAVWAPRIKTGMNTMYTIALKGKGAMPPKGGNASLQDADVKAAVDYLVSLAK